jgi:glycosyltransferase involved in cell wall biosynthesis
VLDAIGGADEAYGGAPCWEMDYNIRAARAGFRGVWAPGAYVYRAAPTARRRQNETRWLEAGKRRYQDKFCGLRLRREQAEYERHCRGEACEHFAPANLITVKLDPRSPRPSPTTDRVLTPAAVGRPLVTCIMPTRGRPQWLRQAIHYFQRQDYSPRELIVVDDGDRDSAAEVSDDPSIRYVHVPPISIGAKRNRACEMARGEFIVQWDDDDWYGSGRLSAQLAPLLADEADMTGLTAEIFLELPDWQFWTCTPELHRRLFFADVHGGTLAFRRRVWQHLARYPDVSLAEDAALLRQALARGARLAKVPAAGQFVYVRHGGNAWAFRCGQHVDPRGWRQIDAPRHLDPDHAFYAALFPENARPVNVSTVLDAPLVSCLMPTADRRPFVPRAVDHFVRQDYPNRELVIVDDGQDKIADLLPSDPRIRYVPVDQRVILGTKRNLACQHARGDIFVHWDDDDWMADWRVSYQVKSLREARADVCGLSTLIFFNPSARRAWRYESPLPGTAWLAGGTLCYTRAHWQAHPFPAVRVGEDTRFVAASQSARRVALDDPTFYAALVHANNTSPKETSGSRYRPYSFDEIVRLLGPDLDRYVDAAQRHRSAAAGRPLISCIMPTYDRRLFVPQAIRCFLRQDYPRKELIVVDDGRDRIGDLIPEDVCIRYVALDRRYSLGEKRNIAVRSSGGTIVAHWDDDDWYHPGYLSNAASRLLRAGNPRAVCGLGTYLVWIAGDASVRICRTNGLAGGTFVYFKQFWEQHPYRDVDRAEDFFFVQDSRPTLVTCQDLGMFVVVRHGSHTWQVDDGRDVTEQLRQLPVYGKRLAEIAGIEDADFYSQAERLLSGAPLS